MGFGIRTPDIRRLMGLQRQQFLRDQRRIGLRVTDRASKVGRANVQRSMKGARLGRLGNAVGQTSALRKGNLGARDHPWGAFYARGGDRTRAGGALEAYSQGANITPEGEWLAFPTRAVPRVLNVNGRRQRLTVELYNQSSLVQSLGPLVFVQKSATKAFYIVNRVTVSAKTGRAQRDSGRKTRTRIRQRAIIVFNAIKRTTRAKRIDKNRDAAEAMRQMPGWAAEEARALGYR